MYGWLSASSTTNIQSRRSRANDPICKNLDKFFFLQNETDLLISFVPNQMEIIDQEIIY
jgi:hypothetical protein